VFALFVATAVFYCKTNSFFVILKVACYNEIDYCSLCILFHLGFFFLNEKTSISSSNSKTQMRMYHQ
jgi:hypothetical protein